MPVRHCALPPDLTTVSREFTVAGGRFAPGHLGELTQVLPFADKPAKAAYMWRDIERRAAMYGIPAKVPAPYPAKASITANLVALLGMREGWGVDFVRAAYRR